MKTVITTAIIAALVFLASVGFFVYRLHVQKPEVIVSRLQRDKDNREELLIQLQLARGDVVGPVVQTFNDRSQDKDLRRALLELLFRRYQREPDERLMPVFQAALKDEDVSIRRQAAYGFAAYLDERLHVNLIESVVDADADVREKAYVVFVGSDWSGRMWREVLTEEHRRRLVELSRGQMQKETQPSLKYLAGSVIGRQIAVWVEDATKALQSGDLTTAEKLLAQSLELDPTSRRAQVRQVRYHLATGDRTKAMEAANRYGVVLHVPKLDAAPTIDGDPTDPVWQKGAKFQLAWQSTARWYQLACEGKTDAYIGHRDGVIYIATLGYEKELDKLSVSAHERDSAVWRDDCIEIIFDPQVNEKDWYQFCINPAGAIFDHYRSAVSNNYKLETQAKVWKERGYWAVEFAIAAKDMDDRKITSDSLWAFNLIRARIGPASEHTVYWPIYGQTANLAFYPLIVFDDAPSP